MTESLPPESVEARWLAALGRLADRVIHEIRNPLNGAVVNAEVLRGRAARPGTDAASLVPFADAAASQLAESVELIEALLALARSPRHPVDLEAVLRPLVRLHAAIAARDGGTVILERGVAAVPATPTAGALARLAVAEALEAVTEAPAPYPVRCTIEARGESITIDIRSEQSGGPADASPALQRAIAREGGITCEMIPSGVRLRFPAVEPAAAHATPSR